MHRQPRTLLSRHIRCCMCNVHEWNLQDEARRCHFDTKASSDDDLRTCAPLHINPWMWMIAWQVCMCVTHSCSKWNYDPCISCCCIKEQHMMQVWLSLSLSFTRTWLTLLQPKISKGNCVCKVHGRGKSFSFGKWIIQELKGEVYTLMACCHCSFV